MNYRYLGKAQILSFDVWPDVSLANARDKKDKAREQIKEGFDPNPQKKLARVRRAWLGLYMVLTRCSESNRRWQGARKWLTIRIDN